MNMYKNTSAAADGRQDMFGQLRAVLSAFPQVQLAVVFGSVARGCERPESDIDIGVSASPALTVAERIAIVEALAARTSRPIDLVDLRTTSEPRLGQILRHGRFLPGTDRAYGELLSRHLFEQADFLPYRTRVLAERGAAWIGM
jgi:predicted nucleotidyltransferase